MNKIEVVAAIILYEDRILCMQRGEGRFDYLSGKFEFPGGKIEPGEGRKTALMRELKEEMDLAISVKDEDYFITIRHMYPDFEITLHSFICKVGDMNFVRNEHIAHKWLLTEELLSVDWAMADMPIVRKIMAGGLMPFYKQKETV